MGLLIFDLDGTLIDSAADIVTTTNEVMHRRQRTPLAADIIIAAIGEGLMPLVHSCFPEAHGNDEMLAAIADEFGAVYEQHLLRETVPFAGIEEFLGATKHQIAIVTNKREKWTFPILKGLGLDRWPWVRIFGADSLTQRKPHPLPLLEAMRAAGTTGKNTIMIGDGLPDMRAAKAAQVPALACRYGYCAAEKLLAEGAWGGVDSPYDLAAAIEDVFSTER